MSTLRSALDERGAEDLRHVYDDDLEADFAELERAAGAMEAELGRRAAEIDRRGSFRRDGYLSISSWLAHRFRMAFSAATQLVRIARALERMPRTRAALSQGEISRSAAAVLVAAHEVDPVEFSRVEEGLVETARTLPITISSAPSPTGGRPSISAGRKRMPSMRSSFGISTSPPPSRAWCGWMATSIPRPGRS